MGSVFCFSFTPFSTLSLFLLSTSSSKPNLGGWCRDPWGRIKKKKSSQSLGLGALPSVKVGGMAVHFFKCCKARGQLSWHVLSPLLWGEEADEEEIQLFQSTSALCPAGACEGGGPTQRDSGREYGRVGRGEGRRRKLQMGKKSSLCMHKCYLKICLARARANSLRLWDFISWAPVIVLPESAAFRSSSIMCVILPHSSRLFSILWPQAEQDIALSFCLSNV